MSDQACIDGGDHDEEVVYEGQDIVQRRCRKCGGNFYEEDEPKETIIEALKKAVWKGVTRRHD